MLMSKRMMVWIRDVVHVVLDFGNEGRRGEMCELFVRCEGWIVCGGGEADDGLEGGLVEGGERTVGRLLGGVVVDEVEGR